jgi:L-iditol 2-dehydrogenase
MAAGKIRVAPLITAVAPLEEGPQWFERLYAREPHLMKVVLDPRKSAEPMSGASA